VIIRNMGGAAAPAAPARAEDPQGDDEKKKIEEAAEAAKNQPPFLDANAGTSTIRAPSPYDSRTPPPDILKDSFANNPGQNLPDPSENKSTEPVPPTRAVPTQPIK
jgi:hypothetical protein